MLIMDYNPKKETKINENLLAKVQRNFRQILSIEIMQMIRQKVKQIQY
jgi:hypothetical protein